MAFSVFSIKRRLWMADVGKEFDLINMAFENLDGEGRVDAAAFVALLFRHFGLGDEQCISDAVANRVYEDAGFVSRLPEKWRRLAEERMSCLPGEFAGMSLEEACDHVADTAALEANAKFDLADRDAGVKSKILHEAERSARSHDGGTVRVKTSVMPDDRTYVQVEAYVIQDGVKKTCVKHYWIGFNGAGELEAKRGWVCDGDKS